MADWKSAAKALAPDMPPDAAERAAKPLETLEAAFRPLVAAIPLETEPAYVLLVPDAAIEKEPS
jgi:hypothetical protein